MKIRPVALLVGALALLSAHGMAAAKLPPPTEEAKAAAAAAAMRSDWSNKVAAYQLCKAQDRVVAYYTASAAAAGKEVKALTAAPGCADPGPFVAAAEPAKPIEAAGAHSPPATATSPPSTTQPAAGMAPKKP